MLILLKLLLSYLAGSVNGGLVIGRFRGVDIRTLGSGNAGGTNALRTQGFWFALGVVIVDVGKGALAAGVIARIGGVSVELALGCAAAAVIGHVYPIWHGFRGGKGAATLVGAVAVLQWPLLPPMLIVWIVVVAISGYVGLATMLAATAMVALIAFGGSGVSSPLGLFAISMMLLIVFTHRSNVSRMLAGEENRNTRLWLLGRGR